MPQENTLSQVLTALDEVTHLKWEQMLLEIAIEHCETHTEKNFDRVSLLLKHLRASQECHLDNLQFALTELQRTLTLLDLKDKSPVLDTCAGTLKSCVTIV